MKQLLDSIKLESPSTTLTPTISGSTSSAQFTVPVTSDAYLYLVWDLRLKPESLICQTTGVESAVLLREACCECYCTATNVEYLIENESNTTLTIEYTNTSGNLVGVQLAGRSSKLLCSQTYPKISPKASNVIVTVNNCDC